MEGALAGSTAVSSSALFLEASKSKSEEVADKNGNGDSSSTWFLPGEHADDSPAVFDANADGDPFNDAPPQIYHVCDFFII